MARPLPPVVNGPPDRWTVVACSLERRGPVRRRIQVIADGIQERHPEADLVFVEPAVDVPHALLRGTAVERSPEVTTEVAPHPGQRRWLVRPRKWLPRAVAPAADRRAARRLVRTVGSLAVADPVLWINDAHAAPLVDLVRWPAVYDVTDDWLHASVTPRERRRLVRADAALVAGCDAVVVCSPALAATRGAARPVDLVPNGVDVASYARPVRRPGDLPAGPLALYAGTLHEDRLDVDLCVRTAAALAGAPLVLVGPDSLSPHSRRRLDAAGNVVRAGPRPFGEVPDYLRAADVVVVPHVVTPFTESLDPIKAYECAAAGRPTVATPVAGFRQLGPPVETVEPDGFPGRVAALVDEAARRGPAPARPLPVADWDERVGAFDAVVARVRRSRRPAP